MLWFQFITVSLEQHFIERYQTVGFKYGSRCNRRNHLFGLHFTDGVFWQNQSVALYVFVLDRRPIQMLVSSALGIFLDLFLEFLKTNRMQCFSTSDHGAALVVKAQNLLENIVRFCPG